jgi:hypothetical protein
MDRVVLTTAAEAATAAVADKSSPKARLTEGLGPSIDHPLRLEVKPKSTVSLRRTEAGWHLSHPTLTKPVDRRTMDPDRVAMVTRSARRNALTRLKVRLVNTRHNHRVGMTTRLGFLSPSSSYSRYNQSVRD